MFKNSFVWVQYEWQRHEGHLSLGTSRRAVGYRPGGSSPGLVGRQASGRPPITAWSAMTPGSAVRTRYENANPPGFTVPCTGVEVGCALWSRLSESASGDLPRGLPSAIMKSASPGSNHLRFLAHYESNRSSSGIDLLNFPSLIHLESRSARRDASSPAVHSQQIRMGLYARG